MFSDNLSTFLLQFCNSEEMTYEEVSELCGISSRYFSDITRRKSAPTITVLEKLCVGLDVTPNDLLISSKTSEAEMAYRNPMPVVQVRCYRSSTGFEAFPVCPRCKESLEREYQKFCDRCGQHLKWTNFTKATIILPDK